MYSLLLVTILFIVQFCNINCIVPASIGFLVNLDTSQHNIHLASHFSILCIISLNLNLHGFLADILSSNISTILTPNSLDFLLIKSL